MISIYMFITTLATTALAKDPVSKPAVSQMCLSPEQMKVSCSSEGDEVDFILTLDGLLLLKPRGHSQNPSSRTANMESLAGIKTEQDKPSVSSVTVNLNGQMTGKLTCHAWNNVSRDETVIHLKSCKVSKPAVSQMCLSPEQMKVSCSSQGDEVELIFTLDGLLLLQLRGHSQTPSSWTANMESLAGIKTDQDKPSVPSVIVSLHGQLTGNLACHAWNNVSRDETVIHLKSCKDLVSSFPVVAVAAGVVAPLLLVALYLGITNIHNKPTTVTECNPEELSEIVYTKVE